MGLVKWVEAAEKLLKGLVNIVRSWRELGGLLSPTPEELQQARKALLDAVTVEVTQRWQDSLHHEELIPVEFAANNEAVGRRKPLEIVPDRRLQVRDRPEVALEARETVVEVFDRVDVKGRLLILGQPGSGKTTMLLELAKDLLERAATSDGDPVPVIFELSAWKDSNQTIAAWLVGQLKGLYNLPVQKGGMWVKQNAILPLLDGLDELGMERQVECVAAINEFLQEDVRRQGVVCCRKEEFDRGGVTLARLNGAIYLQPLSDRQIRDYLGVLERSGLWPLLEGDRELMALARAPFLLTIMVASYRGKPIRNRQELFEAYIDVQFDRDLKDSGYSGGEAPGREQTRLWLARLARQLRYESKTSFLIEQMQPNLWLKSARIKLLYRLIFGFFLVLILAPLGALVVALAGSQNWMLATGLIGGSIWGLSKQLNIRPLESLHLSKINFRKSLFWKKLGFGLTLGISLALLLELFLGFTTGSEWGLFPRSILLLSLGLSFGLVIGMILGLESLIEYRTSSNQGVFNSAKNILYISLFSWPFGLLIILIFGFPYQEELAFRWVNLIMAGFGVSLMFGVIFSGAPVIQHVLLRLFLWLNGSVPWNYARFLNYATQLRFMQRIGGQYRFMHDLLREHFATYEPPVDNRTS
ncbi:NACHT domain-containing NTPase [Synechococcus sp. PCC 7336]|uniref:NACHT domain-containing protein n=1 Tax=Synechococcus sp. PCC 7336 TaxID=195250 RepID=UPI0003682235|nr:NACHT domain-containing protein [Synechococcus sp. PCC 7336]